MVTTSEALQVLFPNGRPLVHWVTMDGLIVKWDPALGPQPTQAQLDAVTQTQVDAAVDTKELAMKPEKNDLRKKVQGFIDEDKVFDDIASPTNAQILAHARRMNKQLLVILRFMKRETL